MDSAFADVPLIRAHSQPLNYATSTEVDALEEACIAEFKAVNERLININAQAMMEEIGRLRTELDSLRTHVVGMNLEIGQLQRERAAQINFVQALGRVVADTP